MEKRQPRWKDYILAVILAVAFLYATFPIKGLLKLMTALYWRYITYGAIGGAAVSVLLHLLKNARFSLSSALYCWSSGRFYPLGSLGCPWSSVAGSSAGWPLSPSLRLC